METLFELYQYEVVRYANSHGQTRYAALGYGKAANKGYKSLDELLGAIELANLEDSIDELIGCGRAV